MYAEIFKIHANEDSIRYSPELGLMGRNGKTIMEMLERVVDEIIASERIVRNKKNANYNCCEPQSEGILTPERAAHEIHNRGLTVSEWFIKHEKDEGFLS